MGTRGCTSGKVSVTIQGTITNTLTDGTVSQVSIGGAVFDKTLTNGVGSLQCNRGWKSISRTIASGQTENIDLHDFANINIGAGVGNDPLGQACDFEEIVALLIFVTAGPGELEINSEMPLDPLAWMPAQTNANGGSIKNGGCRLWAETGETGLDLQDGVSTKIKLKAYGGAVTYSLYVLARHDDNESSSSSASTASSSVSTASSQTISLSFSTASSASSSSASTESSSMTVSSVSSASSTA